MALFSTTTGVAVIDTRSRQGTITLPLTTQIPNRYLQFKDLYGAFGRSSLTLSTQAGETFDDGTTSKLLRDPFTFLQLYAASTTRWAQLGGTQTIQQTVSSLNVSSITFTNGTVLLGTSNLVSTTAQLQSNIEGWSQYTTTTDITLSNTTAITVENPNNALQLKAPLVTIVDAQGGYGSLTVGNQTFATSTTSENYSVGFSPFITGSISSFFVVRSDGVTVDTAPFYISSLYLGNVGGTVAGALTTDNTATNLYWNGSQLNNQGGGGGITTANLQSTVGGLGQIYLSTPTGGGGGIDYVSAFTVSTGYLEVSSISSYSIFTYGVIGTQFFNVGPDPMNITTIPSGSLTSYGDWTMTSGYSTILSNSAFYVASSNDARILAPSNVYLETPEVFATGGISTYSLTIYGPSTLTVQGWSFFQNVLSAPTVIANSIGVFDASTSEPVYIQASNGSVQINGGSVLDQSILASTIEGLGTYGYISTAGGGVSASELISTVEGLGTSGYISTAGGGLSVENLQSTVGGLGETYVSTIGFVENLQSTVAGLGQVYLSTGGGGGIASIPLNLSTNTVLTSSLTASSINVNSLVFGDGNGWAYFGALQAVVASTLQINTGVLYGSSIQANYFIGDGSLLTNVTGGDVTTANLQSTVEGLGEIYVSSATFIEALQSTFGGLGETYVSSLTFNEALQSTFSGLGETYVSSLTFNEGLQSTFSGLGETYVSSLTFIEGLQSTVGGLGETYVSSLTFIEGLQSTVGGLGETYVSSLTFIEGLQSTVGGLGETYVSSLTFNEALQSTFVGLGETYVSSLTFIEGLQSTVGGLGESYVSSITFNEALQSTFGGLGETYVSSLTFIEGLQSTVGGLGETYVSSLTFNEALQSTFGGLGETYVSSLTFIEGLQSTVAGLGEIYVSSGGGGIASIPLNLSTETVLTSSLTASSINVNNLVFGDGNGWAYFGALQAVVTSTIQTNTGVAYASSVTANYFIGDGSLLTNITGGGGPTDYLSAFTVSTSVIGLSSISLIDGNTATLNSLFVSSGLLRFNDSILNGLYSSYYVCQGKLTADETITANTDTVIPFVSDFDPQGWLANAGTSTARFLPNIAGYYIISYQVWWATGSGANQDNIQIRKSGNTIAINQNAIPTVTGLSMNATKLVYLNGSTDYIDFSVYSSTSDPTQTVQYGGTTDGPGTFFSASLVSGGAGGGGGVSQIVAGSNVSISPLGGTGIVTINATGGGGGGGPVDVLSSPVKIGSSSTLSQLAFYGLTGDFNSAVIAEGSSGPGTGDLLLFKGSSINDQIRLTTTGNIVFEPQIAQTEFPNVPPLAIPTMILQSNLVGIATATPGANLDVAGMGRFVTASSVSMYAGAFYGGVFFL